MVRVLLLLALTTSASAQSLPAATAEQRQGLAHALALWEVGSFGVNATGSGDLDMRPVADGFTVKIPIRDFAGPDARAGVLTLHAKAGPGRAWSIDDMVLPSPLVTVAKPPGALNAVRTEQHFGRQGAHAVVDPTLATATHAERSIDDWTVRTGAPGTASPGNITEIGRLQTTIDWTPEGTPGEVALHSRSQAERMSVLSRADRATFVRIESLEVGADVRHLDLEAYLGHMRAGIGGLSAWIHTGFHPVPDMARVWAVAAPLGAPTLSHEQARALGELIQGLRQIMGDGTLRAELHGLHGAGGGVEGGCDTLTMLQAVHPDAQADLADWRLAIGLDGLSSTKDLRPWLPQRVTLTPVMSRLPAGELWHLLDTILANPDAAPAAGRLALPLLVRAGSGFGIEDVLVDFGDATVSGYGDVNLVDDKAGADAVAGGAEVTATGFGALAKRILASPAKPQVKAAVLFLKGLGERQGDRTLWHVSLVHGRILVNGTDLSALAPK